MRNGDAGRGILQRLFAILAFSLLTTSLLHAQEIKTVTGIILDDNGVPVSNASIVIKGSNQAVGTDIEGKFTLKVKKGDVLQITHISFSPRRITYDNQTHLQIRLQTNDAAMSEVVVTGYQNVRKKLFSGSSSTLTAKELDRPGATDVTRMLEGQFAGVSLQNVSGTFGAAPKLRIRGATSLSGDNKPLWVIDGIIVEDVVNISNEALTSGDMSTLLGSSVAGVNLADVQDITILRDAAATALYGARAMNGVVVITTKKGRSSTNGSPVVSYTGNFSMYIKPRYEEFDILNSADQMGVLVEEMNKGLYQMPDIKGGGTGGVLLKMYNLIDAYDSTNGAYGLRNDPASKRAFLQRYADANTDWFDIIFKNSFIQEHSVSVSSGTDKFQTYASTSYLKDNGQTLGNNVERFTGNLRTNFKMGTRVRGELLATGSVRNQRAPGTQNQQAEPVYGSYLRGFDINPYNYALNASRMLTPYDENGNLEYFTLNYAPFNIINELNTNYMKLQVLDFKVQGGLNIRVLPHVEYSINGAYRYVKSESQTSILEKSNLAQAYRAAKTPTSIGNNEYLYPDPDRPNDPAFVVLPSGGFYNVQMNNLKYLYFRHSLDYSQTFNDHTVTAFASMEARNTERQYEFFDGVGYQFENGGLVSPYYMYFKKAAEQGKTYFGMYPGKDKFLAYMVTATYGYKGKYVFTPTFRYDGSNKMGKSTVARWLPTWNLAGSWNIQEESFWPNNNALTSMTLRSSYGLTGNIGSATNSAATYYNLIARRPYINDQETLTYLSDLENSQLTWEKSKDLDIGMDLGFMNNRITLTTDYYKRSIQNLIGDIKTSGIGGQFVKKGNYGTMNAEGIEFTLNAKVIKTRDFQWSSRFNVAHNKNKITRLETDPIIFTAVSGNGGAVKGYPARGLFSVPFAGLDHYHGYPTYIGSGKDQPVTTYLPLQDDILDNLKYEGSVEPTLTGGLYNQFSYKGFTLAGLLKFSTGNVLRLRPQISPFYFDMQAMSKDVLNRWTLPGDETRTTIPALIDPVSAVQIIDDQGGQVNALYPYNLYNFSTERVVNGQYLKLASLSLGYQLPQKVCSLLSMTNASITAVTNNILIIYADKRLNGQDPEFYNSGGVALPTSKQVTVSLKVGF
jgi:TonB-linked SusC/RagA family outer membrane protein